MTQTPEDFEPFDKTKIKELTSENSIPDPTWSARIATLAVGSGFRIKRPETENVRQLKKRINKAAGTSFRTLEWYPEQKNLPEDQEPTSFIVKVRALDLKAKAAAEDAAKNGVQSATEPQQATNGDSSTLDTPETPNAPRAPRNRP